MRKHTPNRIKHLASIPLLLAVSVGILLTDAPVPLVRTHGAPAAIKDKVSAELRDGVPGDRVLSVILQLNAEPAGQLNALLNRNGVHVKDNFESFNSYALDLPASVVEELAGYDEVEFISSDLPLEAFGHVTTTTGAEMVRAQKTAAGTAYTLDGTGIGIAVLDSGLYLEHKAFQNDKGTSRVVYSQDFTGENQKGDPYGHGTHVAAAAAGLGTPWKGQYTGIAPNAKIINLRVLNSQGRGTTSGLLSALNWVYNNRANTTYNIRVVNMSLGTAAVASYRNDPVCLAARKLVDAGIVVVAAAGNNGKDSAGQKTYGNIHSPGNEPSVITVGSANTFGTDARSDDAVTTYSSRGPTRSYRTDSSGMKHYDNLVKPDLVAPGNKVIYAESYNCALVTQHKELNTGLYPTSNMNQMYLNGTSVAAPITAGAAALLLQANPRLTPNMVKMILMYTAQQLAGFNALEQGAGELNLEGAVRLAKLVRTDLTTTTALGAPLLTTATAPSPQSTVAGTTFPWAQGIIMDQTYARGANLIMKYQRVYGQGALLADGTTLGSGVLMTDGTLMTDGVLLGDNIMTSSGVLLGDGWPFLGTGSLLGDGVLLGDGALLADGVLLSDGSMMADGSIMGDLTTVAQSVLISGDNTSCMY